MDSHQHIRVDGILISHIKIRMCNIWSLIGCIVDYTYITVRKVAVACAVYTYNRSSPIGNFSEETLPNLRTIIVIADIDRGLYSPADASRYARCEYKE